MERENFITIIIVLTLIAWAIDYFFKKPEVVTLAPASNSNSTSTLNQPPKNIVSEESTNTIYNHNEYIKNQITLELQKELQGNNDSETSNNNQQSSDDVRNQSVSLENTQKEPHSYLHSDSDLLPQHNMSYDLNPFM